MNERTAERVAKGPQATVTARASAAPGEAALSPTEEWSRRVRFVGGLIQAAFAAFWLIRGSRAIGGGAADVLIPAFGVVVIGVFVYAFRAASGITPRPKSAEGKRIERAVTIATVIEFAAAFALPVIVVTAGHSDWVLPSIAITIGPLLLWLDREVNVPRYRPVGWALTVGPVILVATLSGTALVATTGIAAGVLLLGTAVAGFRELAVLRRRAERVIARPDVVSPDVLAPGAPECSGGEPLHVVFGTGQVGRALAARLVRLGVPVRAVSRNRPSGLPDGVEWRAADASDPEAATAAAEGASVIYQCLNAPYTNWPELFPPLQRGVLSAAERTGALLVSLENLYGYGPTAGAPMTEDLPLAATTVKGRTRAAMTAELLAAAEAGRVRIAIGRASDFFGAGVTETTLGERVFANALVDKRADFIGNPDLAHTYSYVPDVAAGLATLGTDERAVGGIWHLPGPETTTTREVLALLSGDVGHTVEIRSVPKLVVRALGVFNPLMRGLAEMSYEFDEPFVLDTTKYEATFGTGGTPLSAAIGTTVGWYRGRNGASSPSEAGTRS